MSSPQHTSPPAWLVWFTHVPLSHPDRSFWTWDTCMFILHPQCAGGSSIKDMEGQPSFMSALAITPPCPHPRGEVRCFSRRILRVVTWEHIYCSWHRSVTVSSPSSALGSLWVSSPFPLGIPRTWWAWLEILLGCVCMVSCFQVHFYSDYLVCGHDLDSSSLKSPSLFTAMLSQ